MLLRSDASSMSHWELRTSSLNIMVLPGIGRSSRPRPIHIPVGRTLLRFEAVDYLAEVWVNGKPVGGHEGSETPFELDVTDVVHPGASNLLAVRVLNPTNGPGTASSSQKPRVRVRLIQLVRAIYNVGGIVDSVSLLSKPALRIEDVYVVADWKTGAVRVQADVFRSAGRFN